MGADMATRSYRKREVMEAEWIQAALTYDQHFAQAGFETLLR
jgi:predicted nucleic acid-binding protein